MNIGPTLIVEVSAFAIAACATFLVFHPSYEDGIFGRIALAGLVLACTAMLMDAWIGGVEYEFLPSTVLAALSMALFMLRHTYRFLRWRLSGDGDWRGSKA